MKRGNKIKSTVNDLDTSCPAASLPWCNQIISTISSLFFNIYTLTSFNTKSPSICYLSSLKIFTLTFFIFFTNVTIFLSFPFVFLFFLLNLPLVLLLLPCHIPSNIHTLHSNHPSTKRLDYALFINLMEFWLISSAVSDNIEYMQW